MMMMMMRMSQKVASNRLKIEYVVAWNISLDILVPQIFVKKSYGFTAIWSQIFFRTKIYYIRSNARDSHQKSFKSCLKSLYDGFYDMEKEFFCAKSHMRTPLEFRFTGIFTCFHSKLCLLYNFYRSVASNWLYMG